MTSSFDEPAPIRGERLLTLSSAARRLSDIIAVAREPVAYDVLRHMLRVSEETMTEVLDETVRARLIRRGDTPYTYVPHDEETGAAIASWIDEGRAERIRSQIAGAQERVFE